ncbi:site-specific integrase [Paenibacillus sp. XY044]|uniref:tyrosine-type recombinase/integrase n=1 Tax=Paenibacillus sp. XY044 TaxID=2026089 RepID=UPI000B99689C|nr:site-specific integrase [Paenibacillus sp. XY044]OZB96551.1 hypothetical protein CJP46_11785 [Paenibacillus sp. XY044]
MERFLQNSIYYQNWKKHFTLAKSTRSKYEIALRRFEAYLLKQGFDGELDFDRFHADKKFPDRFSPIKRKVIDHFVQFLIHDLQVSDSTVSISVTALKNFFGFLYDMDLIQQNPMINYPTPKFERGIQNTALSKEDSLEVLRAALRLDPFYRRGFVMIWLMLITGMRISEVRFLRCSRVKLESKIVHIFEGQKTTKRSAAISKDLADEITRYINHPQYLEWSKQGDEFLFNNKGNPLQPRVITRLLDRVSNEAGLSRSVRAHDLRRTAAYLMQIGGLSMVEIQHQLGHVDLATTLQYVPALGELARIFEDSFDY